MQLRTILALIFLGFSTSSFAACKWKTGSVSAGGSTSPTWVWACDSVDEGGGDPGDGSESGGGAGPGAPSQAWACGYLSNNRPPSCPANIPYPSGTADYGADSYAGGSGLAKLIYLKNSGLLRESDRSWIELRLIDHTNDIVFGSFDEALVINRRLIIGVANGCIAIAEGDKLSWPYQLTDGARKCQEALEILVREAGGETMVSAARDWMDLNKFDIGLGYLGLESVIAALSPDNSLTTKFNKLQAETKCAQWWEGVMVNRCSVP